MTISQIEQFYRIVEQDKALQKRLWIQVNLPTVCRLAVQLGLEYGYSFTAEEVEATILNQTQPWDTSRYQKKTNLVTQTMDADTCLRQSYTHIMNGNFLAALESCDQALKINSQFADAYYNRGYINTDLRQLHQAIEDYSQAIAIKPNHADAYLGRSICRADIGDTQSAVSDAEIAAEIYQKQDNINSYERAKAFIARICPINSANSVTGFVNKSGDQADRGKLHSVLTEFASIIVRGGKTGLTDIAAIGYRELGRGIVAVGVQSDSDGSLAIRMIDSDPDVCYLTQQDLPSYNQGDASRIRMMEEQLDNYNPQTELVVCFTHSYAGSVVIKVKL